MSSIKKQMFGSFGATIPVGGTLPVAPDVMKKYNEHQAALRGSKVPVPAFYHAPPVKLCEELEHCYNLEVFHTLTFGDGVLAMTALRARKPAASA